MFLLQQIGDYRDTAFQRETEHGCSFIGHITRVVYCSQHHVIGDIVQRLHRKHDNSSDGWYLNEVY